MKFYAETTQGMARLVEDVKRLDENYMEKLTAVNKQTPPDFNYFRQAWVYYENYFDKWLLVTLS